MLEGLASTAGSDIEWLAHSVVTAVVVEMAVWAASGPDGSCWNADLLDSESCFAAAAVAAVVAAEAAAVGDVAAGGLK